MERRRRLGEMTRQVVHLAHKEAAFFQHRDVRPEHLLLSILAIPEAVGHRLLRRQGLNPQVVLREVVSQLFIGHTTDPQAISLSTEARAVLDAAVTAAQLSGAPYVGTDHLLLGILDQSDSVASGVLLQLGLNSDLLRRQIVALYRDVGDSRPAK